jgi:hypothetical protein
VKRGLGVAGSRGTGRVVMNMRVVVLRLALALTLIPTAASAFYEPDGFRGVKWGTSATEAEQALKALHAKRVLVGDEPVCDRAPGGVAVADSAVCTAQTHVGTVRVKLYFEFYQDRFVSVTLLSTPTRYADLRRSFIERYGPPTRAETKMRIGPFSEHLGEEVLWDGPSVHIKLAQYVGGPTLSVAVISLRSEVDRRAVEPERSSAPPPPEK